MQGKVQCARLRDRPMKSIHAAVLGPGRVWSSQVPSQFCCPLFFTMLSYCSRSDTLALCSCRTVASALVTFSASSLFEPATCDLRRVKSAISCFFFCLLRRALSRLACLRLSMRTSRSFISDGTCMFWPPCTWYCSAMTPAPGTAMPRAQAPTGMPGLCIPGISTPGPGCMLTPSGAREPGPLAAAQKWVTLANEDLNLEPTKSAPHASEDLQKPMCFPSRSLACCTVASRRHKRAQGLHAC
mmetsp:Transcript_33966/g.101087  ORF Transcript_33966/g.101087 Transcript_33966/m.101087 type:complete len:242 (-) Transcript_33966:45-770(-)